MAFFVQQAGLGASIECGKNKQAPLLMKDENRLALKSLDSLYLSTLDQAPIFSHMVIFVTHMRILTTWYFAA